MKLTPIDISHKTFTKKMFGLDEAEVYEFLSTASQQLEAVIHERNQLRDQLRDKEVIVSDLKEKDFVLQSTISTASNMADRYRQDAERESRLIIMDANQKAETITRDAQSSLKKIYEDIATLKRVRMQFEANLKAIAQAHLSLLEQGEKYVPTMNLSGLGFESAAGPSPASPARESVAR